MHEYSNVEVTLYDDQLSKSRQETKSSLSIKKDSEKTYSILVKRGEIFTTTFFLSPTNVYLVFFLV